MGWAGNVDPSFVLPSAIATPAGGGVGAPGASALADLDYLIGLQAEFAAQAARAAAESSALTQDLIAFLEVACMIGLSRDVITDYCEEWCSKGERMAEHHLADEARINRKAHDEDLEAGRALRARGPWTEERCEAGAEPSAEAC